ncbi:MAG: hypothetical protein ACO3JL_16890 [Myxococcota bacterium]
MATPVRLPEVRCSGLSAHDTSTVDAAVLAAARQVVGVELLTDRPVLPARCGDDEACVTALRSLSPSPSPGGIVLMVRCQARPGYFRAGVRALRDDGSFVGIAERRLTRPPELELWRLLMLEALEPRRATGTVTFIGIGPALQVLVDGLPLSASERRKGLSLSAGQHVYQLLDGARNAAGGVFVVNPGETLVIEDLVEARATSQSQGLDDNSEASPGAPSWPWAALGTLGAVTGSLGAALAVGEGIFGDDEHPQARGLSLQIAGISGGISLVAIASASVLWLRQQAAQQEVP